jgi:hypothetical protein
MTEMGYQTSGSLQQTDETRAPTVGILAIPPRSTHFRRAHSHNGDVGVGRLFRLAKP